MALTVSIAISRTLLGLGDLEINDHSNFYVAELGDVQVSWNRQTVSAPWFDGEVTVQRNKSQVQQRMTIEVLSDGTTARLRSNQQALIRALEQDSFQMTLTVDGESTVYACEASDWMVEQNKEHAHSRRARMTVNLYRNPVPVSGVY